LPQLRVRPCERRRHIDLEVGEGESLRPEAAQTTLPHRSPLMSSRVFGGGWGSCGVTADSQRFSLLPQRGVGTSPTACRARQVSAAEIARRVEDALRLVQLGGLGGRWPHQLSGASCSGSPSPRALVIRPQVLLFDEPLSNLDARLRVSMRGEIRELHEGARQSLHSMSRTIRRRRCRSRTASP